jgi:RNA polymerase sigma factor (TIGR02999 family)
MSVEARDAPAGEITLLLAAAKAGDGSASDRLFSLVYEDLRRVARRQLRARLRPTLTTTALVHETYLKLSASGRWSARDRVHFFALAARAMRQIVVDYARQRTRVKRGGRVAPVSLDPSQALAGDEAADEILAVDQALSRLSEADPELARLVEWRFFGGLSVDEIARTLEVSDRTVKRHWRAARAFLYRELGGERGAS